MARLTDRFALTLALAFVGHGLVLAIFRGAPRVTHAADVASVELDVVPWEDAPQEEAWQPSAFQRERPPLLDSTARGAPASAAAAGITRAPGAVSEGATVPGGATVPEDLLAAPEGLATELESAPVPTVEGAPAGAAKKGVNLYLGRGELAELVGHPKPKSRKPKTPPGASQGRKAQLGGLEGLSADQGPSASSPAVSAGYRSAKLAPSVGTAVFEVRVNAEGKATAVYLLGDDASGAWSAVTNDLLARLTKSIFSLPAGAKGLVARFRIDRGYLAKELSERGRTKRSVAIGQEHHAKDYGWDESTQAATRPNRLAPSLGVSSDDLRTTIPTRVLLLSQELL